MDYCWLILVHSLAGVMAFGLASDWSYDDHHGDDGPQNWHKHFEECGKSQQSPIDFNPSHATFADDVDPFTFTRYQYADDRSDETKFELVNNGHTVQLNVNSNRTSISGGALPSTYSLVQVHMHWGSEYSKGSEHTINGWTYPVEIHFVHYDSKKFTHIREAMKTPGGLAVLGVFAQIKQIAFRHDGLQHIIDGIHEVENRNTSTQIPAFSLRSLLPSNTDEFYRYTGSLTTPPCFESVIWTVFRQPINISSSQVESLNLSCGIVNSANFAALSASTFLCLSDDKLWKLRTLNHNNLLLNETDVPLVNNFRPVQPLNGRTVLRTFRLQSELGHGTSTGAYATSHPFVVGAMLVAGYLSASR